MGLAVCGVLDMECLGQCDDAGICGYTVQHIRTQWLQCKQGSVVSICTNMDCCRVSGRSDYEVSLVYVQQTVTLYEEFPDCTGM